MEETAVEPSPSPAPRRRKWLKITLISLFILVVIAAGIGFYLYNLMTGDYLSSRSKDVVITIPEAIDTPEKLADLLAEENIITNKFGFTLTASWMNYKVKKGKFKLAKDKNSHRELIQVLRGSQMTIALTLHNIRTKEQLAGHLARTLDSDSLLFLSLFYDKAALEPYNVSPETVMSLFLPDTYEIYWNTSPADLLKRMDKESKNFWSQNGRLEKAKKLELSPTQIYTLASIVETETQYAPEKPTIAGVYLNRLQKNWKLEADPTVVFAVGDFTIRRVLRSHLETDSPYNTYKYEGLPPGPIYMASKTSIDAVLSPEKHEYMFFCAKVGGDGTHAFAKSLDGHLSNARQYQQWLNSQKVYR